MKHATVHRLSDTPPLASPKLRLNARARALALLACLHVPVLTMAQNLPLAPPEVGASDEALQPKFVWWGFLLNIAFKYAMEAFADYLESRLSQDVSATTMNRLMLSTSRLAVVALSDVSPFGSKSAGAAENTVAGESTQAIKRDTTRENYQAVHVALMRFDAAGKPLGYQPVTAGFQTGDRFKLKVLPTFDGVMVIENVNPAGQRGQIYPPRSSEVVQVKAGAEILLPLGGDEFFEFAGEAGDEQLVFTLRDPRAFGAAASSETVNRKDDRTGSSFVQELKPGTYPVIAQSLKINHRK